MSESPISNQPTPSQDFSDQPLPGQSATEPAFSAQPSLEPSFQQESPAVPESSAQNPNLQFVPEELRPQPEQLLLEWEAASRPFKKRNRKYYTTIGIIVFLISLILFFAGQFLPIAVVISVAFLAYVLSAVPPEKVVNRITTFGIRTDQSIYYWEEMGRFWFVEKYGQPVLHIEVAKFPNQITILLTGNITQQLVTEILSQVLVEEQPIPTAFDKAAKWLQEKIPLDTDA